MVLAAIIMSGASLIGGIFSNISVNKTNKDMLEYNKEINSFNNAEQWKMWNATNNYNTPENQMLRYAEAGLNPNLIYGQSNTTSPVNVGTSTMLSSLQPKNYSFLAEALEPMMRYYLSDPKGRELDHTAKEISNSMQGILKEIAEKTKDSKISFTQYESQLLQKQLKKITNELNDYDKNSAIRELERTLKRLNIEWDTNLAKMNLPPDLDARDALLFSMIGGLFSAVTGNQLNFKDVLFSLGKKITNGLNFKKD